MDMITLLGGFLAGVATGAGGTYMAYKYTDRRREGEAQRKEREIFQKVAGQMPELVEEMRRDLSLPDFRTVREFFIIPKKARINTRGPAFTYHPEDHANLQGKLVILENRGYIIDVTPGNAPKYRMTEEFVELVIKS